MVKLNKLNYIVLKKRKIGTGRCVCVCVHIKLGYHNFFCFPTFRKLLDDQFEKSVTSILQALDEDTKQENDTAERILRELKQAFFTKKKNQELRVKSLKNTTTRYTKVCRGATHIHMYTHKYNTHVHTHTHTGNGKACKTLL